MAPKAVALHALIAAPSVLTFDMVANALPSVGWMKQLATQKGKNPQLLHSCGVFIACGFTSNKVGRKTSQVEVTWIKLFCADSQ